jgi:DNA (cytosine-5)-methyltransferase 1
MEMSVSEPPTVLSLYCGAGGLDHGFRKAGFQLSGAIDFDPAAVSTYRDNVSDDVVCDDVSLLGRRLISQPELIIGGPPCQGFSVIGKMNSRDPRSRHVNRFMDIVEARRPRAFVMENVKALATSSRWQSRHRRLEARARSLGFQVQTFVLDASEYGVPQVRERMFLVGMRDATPVRPAPTSTKRPTVRAALKKLAPYGEPGNSDRVIAKVVPAKKPVIRPSPFRGSLLFNGSGRPLDLDRPARTLPASMGGNATPILDQEELENDAAPWVLGYHAHLLAGGAPRKTAPSRLRRLTVEEAAALQSFPKGWKFAGSQVAQLRQIGNAVPPKLAYRVAISVREALERS